MVLFVLFALMLQSGHNAVSGEVIEYKRHIIRPERPEYLIIPKYSKRDIPSWSPGRGRSYIDISRLKLKTACTDSSKNEKNICRDSKFEMLMFEAPKDKPWTEYWEMDDFCCTEEIFRDGQCSKINTLILPKKLSSAAMVMSQVVKVNGDEDTEAAITPHLNIEDTGLYVLLMAVCDPAAAPVQLDGSVDSLDPYGYVPADLFGDLPFYFALSCSYLIVGVAWMILCAVFSDELMPLQMWISGVLAVGMIETTLLFAHFLNWNDKGVPALGITVTGLLFGTIKRAMSRVLVLLVSLGYGVVRPSLGDDMRRVLLLGCAYFVLSLTYTLLINLPGTGRAAGGFTYNVVSAVVFVLAAVDTTFYIWVFSSVNSLLVSLASRKQGVKYLLYRNFRAVLLTLFGLTCAWGFYSSVVFMNDISGANSNWREKWTIDALWELIYFVIFVAIAVLWAPSRNAQRYAYSVELTQLEDDDEYQQETSAAFAIASGSRGLGGVRGGAGDSGDEDLDGEYGGRLQDETDPFQGGGALDPAMAIAKKQ